MTVPTWRTAEAHYGAAMALASELGMGPLFAHCHLGLGKLYLTASNGSRGTRLDSPGLSVVPLLFMKQVKVLRRLRGRTRISAKNQATIPVDALRRAGLKPGDELHVEAAGAGRIVLARPHSLIDRHAGSLTGVYPKGYLTRLRREWR